MDTEIKTLAQIKAMSGRNLDSSVNDSTLVSGETSAGTFGVFKFFQGIKNFFKNAQALATLTATSRITVTDADGNVTYTTPNAIKSTLGLATTSELNSALANYMNVSLNTVTLYSVTYKTNNLKYYVIGNMLRMVGSFTAKTLSAWSNAGYLPYPVKDKIYIKDINGNNLFYCRIQGTSYYFQNAVALTEDTIYYVDYSVPIVTS